MSMMKAVRFDEYGDSSVLQVRDTLVVPPGPGQVRVETAYAGINPGEIIIREGVMHDFFPGNFPDEGQGSDFSGTVVEVGEGVNDVKVGDAVIGMSDERSAQAEYVTIAQDRLVPLPEGLDPAVAACLYVAGTTAWAAVGTVAPRSGETVVASAAAGGVGLLAAQLARRAGADVIGIASASSARVLSDIGVRPIEYGDGLVERLRAAAPSGIDAFVDCYGSGYVEAALELGVSTKRINTIIDFEAVQLHGVQMAGMAVIKDPAPVVSRIAELLASGEIVLPIRAVYPLGEVRSAYEDLATRHGVGKIVLRTGRHAVVPTA